MKVTYEIFSFEAPGRIKGAWKTFETNHPPQSKDLVISFEIPGKEKDYADFSISTEDNGFAYYPQREEMLIHLIPTDYMIPGSNTEFSWDKETYNRFCEDINRLCREDGWELLVDTDENSAPETRPQRFRHRKPNETDCN